MKVVGVACSDRVQRPRKGRAIQISSGWAWPSVMGLPGALRPLVGVRGCRAVAPWRAGARRAEEEGEVQRAGLRGPQQGEVEMCRWSGYLMAGG